MGYLFSVKALYLSLCPMTFLHIPLKSTITPGKVIESLQYKTYVPFVQSYKIQTKKQHRTIGLVAHA